MHRRYAEARRLLPALFLTLVLLTSCGLSRGRGTKLPDPRQPLKRELRAAWLPTIYRSEYAQLSPYDAADLLLQRVETLHQLGCNAIFFQVRAEGDAWYPSALEPWSKYLTGRQGQAPEEPWDPLELVLEACHERGMELHAWINPYRGASNASAELAPTHPARRYPELFIRYGGQLLMNPGHPQSIPYITSVVKDLVTRYDLDGLHFDDYFYPYPKAGEELQDEETFRAYGLGKGYARGEKARWRRDKVNELIRATRETLLELRPWMRFGVSPFGIYRNASTAPEGSQTAGLQSYDDLSADVLYWAHEGWVDYVVPQVYWNRGHKVADYDVLVPWWAEQLPRTTQLYIGQHVGRTMEGRQLEEKLQLSRHYAQGNVWWPADDLLRNVGGIGDSLATSYQRYPALLPVQRGVLGKTKAPAAPSRIWLEDDREGFSLCWEDRHQKDDPESPYLYVVYAFPRGTKVSTKDPRYIRQISRSNRYRLTIDELLDGEHQFLVTALNRFWQESKPHKLKIRP